LFVPSQIQNHITYTVTKQYSARIQDMSIIFRFVWPCIINVGEERTNRWHGYRCLFTI